MIQVSVVVPTCRRDGLLNRCLQALVAQEFDPARYEIVVVDDAPSLATQSLVASWAASHNGHNGTQPRAPSIRYVRTSGRRGPATARNRGWRAARGAIIAFTDDDCIPDPAWLRNGVSAFKDGVAGVSGRVVVPLPAIPTDYELNVTGLERSEFVTANCFYRRDALAAIDGFDEQFTTPWREDSDLFFRMLKQRCRLVAAPDAIVTHPVRPPVWGISLPQQKKNIFNALLYKKHPELYRQRLQPVTPWRYYGITGALLIALAGRMTGHRKTLWGGLLAWVLLTARFCAQRLRGTSRAPSHVAEMVVTSALIPPVAVFWRLYGALRYRVLFL